MADIKTNMTLDEYLSAWTYLRAKREAEQKAANPATRNAVVMN